jgi:hypothetical protein
MFLKVCLNVQRGIFFAARCAICLVGDEVCSCVHSSRTQLAQLAQGSNIEGDVSCKTNRIPLANS